MIKADVNGKALIELLIDSHLKLNGVSGYNKVTEIINDLAEVEEEKPLVKENPET